MPFGSTSAPGTFTKAICLAFRELLDIIASYFDSVMVYSKYLNHCLSHLRQAFGVVRKYNFTLRPDKCLFFQENAELLEYIVSPNEIKLVSKTLNKVANFELPKNKTELTSFIYLYGFYTKHVQSFAENASHLTNLLKKDNKFIFSPKEITVWNLLKAQTLNACQLAFFNSTFQDKVYTNAGDIGIEGIYI